MAWINNLSNKLNSVTRNLEQKLSKPKKDKHKTFVEMVRDYDYPIEKHIYKTEDDYYNTVFRISGPRGTTA